MHVQCMFKRLIHRDLLYHFWPKTSEVWNDGTKLHCETNGLKSLWCFRRFKRYRRDWVPFQRDIFGCWDVENHKMLAAKLANLGMFDAEASDEFIPWNYSLISIFYEMLLHEPSWICLMLPLCLFQFWCSIMFHVFWRLTWTTRIWRHPQLHYLQTLRQEGGTHFKLQTSRKDILNLPVLQKEARGRGASGCTHLPSMEQQAGMFLYSVSDDQRLIDQIEDQQSLAMNRALNIMPWMVELMFFQRLVMSIQLGLWLGNPSRTFRNSHGCQANGISRARGWYASHHKGAGRALWKT